jgi:guanylate kinase
MTGVILYGPPASGKDSVAVALEATGEFHRFHRMKCGPGRSNGYRLITKTELARLAVQPDEVVWTTTAYGATYLVDRSHLLAMIGTGRQPVVQLGEPDAVTAVVTSTPDVRWIVVELWCPREVAVERIRERQTGDTSQRVRRYDETPRLAVATAVQGAVHQHA